MKVKILFILLLSICQSTLSPVLGGNDTEAIVSVAGRVVDKDGEPLSGVKIRISGMNEPIYTDFEGNFTLPCPVKGKVMMELSMVSFQNKQLLLDSEKIIKENLVSITLESNGLF